MDIKNLRVLLTRLTYCFLSTIASFAIMLVGSSNLPAYQGSHAFWSFLLGVVVLVWLCSGIVFYVYLIRLTRRLGRSSIVWAGLAFVTSPIGPVVAFSTCAIW